MKQIFIGLALVAAIAVVSGCHRSHSWEAKSYKHYQPGDGAIDLAAGEVVIRAGGQPEDAHVASDGQLRLGHHPIQTSAEGRAALRQYYAAAAAFREHAVALGVAGAHFGIQTAEHVLKGLFDGTVDKAGDEADKGAAEIQRRAFELCDRFRDAYLSQNLAAAAVAEFKPYAVISAKQVQECEEDRKPDEDEPHPAAKSDSQA